MQQIEQYSYNLPLQRLTCPHCEQVDQFVSHGYVYKQISHNETKRVGKRLFCSNRYHRFGCGRTIRLRINVQIPQLHYSCFHFFLFICALINGFSVTQAYQHATRTTCEKARNAWRWLCKLDENQSHYRLFIHRQGLTLTQSFKERMKRLHILLPVLSSLVLALDNNACQQFQLMAQQAFA